MRRRRLGLGSGAGAGSAASLSSGGNRPVVYSGAHGEVEQKYGKCTKINDPENSVSREMCQCTVFHANTMRVDSAVEDAKKAAKLQGGSRRSRLTRSNLNLKARVPQTPTALLSFLSPLHNARTRSL